MRAVYTPTREVRVLEVDQRSVEDLVWCAASYSAARLYWIRGRLLCVEVYEHAIEKEIDEGILVVSQLCWAPFPEYQPYIETRGGFRIPIVRAAGMKFFEALCDLIDQLKEKPRVRVGYQGR
ncbi:hypothetical protein DRN94_002715 [archaeon]|nr:hypothetical protein [archaeon]